MRIEIDRDKCNGCGDCVPVCPRKAIELKDQLYANGLGVWRLPKNIPVTVVQRAEADPDRCDCCGDCLAVCKPNAIRVHGRKKG